MKKDVKQRGCLRSPSKNTEMMVDHGRNDEINLVLRQLSSQNQLQSEESSSERKPVSKKLDRLLSKKVTLTKTLEEYGISVSDGGSVSAGIENSNKNSDGVKIIKKLIKQLKNLEKRIDKIRNPKEETESSVDKVSEQALRDRTRQFIRDVCTNVLLQRDDLDENGSLDESKIRRLAQRSANLGCISNATESSLTVTPLDIETYEEEVEKVKNGRSHRLVDLNFNIAGKAGVELILIKKGRGRGIVIKPSDQEDEAAYLKVVRRSSSNVKCRKKRSSAVAGVRKIKLWQKTLRHCLRGVKIKAIKTLPYIRAGVHSEYLDHFQWDHKYSRDQLKQCVARLTGDDLRQLLKNTKIKENVILTLSFLKNQSSRQGCFLTCSIMQLAHFERRPCDEVNIEGIKKLLLVALIGSPGNLRLGPKGLWKDPAKNQFDPNTFFSLDEDKENRLYANARFFDKVEARLSDFVRNPPLSCRRESENKL